MGRHLTSSYSAHLTDDDNNGYENNRSTIDTVFSTSCVFVISRSFNLIVMYVSRSHWRIYFLFRNQYWMRAQFSNSPPLIAVTVWWRVFLPHVPRNFGAKCAGTGRSNNASTQSRRHRVGVTGFFGKYGEGDTLALLLYSPRPHLLLNTIVSAVCVSHQSILSHTPYSHTRTVSCLCSFRNTTINHG